MIKVAILASGTGTNAMKLLEKAKSLSGLTIPLVIVDQKDSLLLKTIDQKFSNVRVCLVEAPRLNNLTERKRMHETAMLELLKEHQIDWIFLAGYMRLLGPTLLQAFQGSPHSKIVNIHPSLLPAYPGLHAYEQAYEANAAISGVTIHFVDSGLDTGSVIVQGFFERAKTDTLENFINRGKDLEWKLYPEVLQRLNDQGYLEEKK